MSERRPLIGIPTQTLHAIDGIPAGLPSSWVMNRRYYDAAAAAGAVPVMVPLFDQDLATLRAIYDRLDGVLLAGGVDMDPCTYGAVRSDRTGTVDPARDAVELQLARWAITDRKPLFGICRGLQVINVALGGTLLQDIAAERPAADKHDFFPTAGWGRDHLAHPVTIEDGSLLRAAFGQQEVLVNSMHHQAVDRLADGLRVTATAPDGVIEAIEGSGPGYLAAVQWHPEVLGRHATDLLAGFVAAAR